MDILNWLYLAKNKFVRTAPSSDKDLMIFGAKVGTTKRGDLYQNYAMSVEDFTTSVADVVKPYKVYTALLTQSGGNDPLPLNSGLLTIGVTYMINNPNVESDFTNVGAPNNLSGTYFVATGTTPNNWGSNRSILTYNTGAPVVTVLENTIGDIWFTYSDVGSYLINSNGLFTISKTFLLLTNPNVGNGVVATASYNDIDSIGIVFYDNASPYEVLNGVLSDTPIEIRVYN